MPHNDQALWAEYAEIAEETEDLRLRAHELTRRGGYPEELKGRAGLLSYHLRAAHQEAKALAGDRPAAAPQSVSSQHPAP